MAKQFTTKALAQKEAKKQGKSGVHKMPNGKWMIGKNHKKSNTKRKY